ncbi:MAG: hypothetical protein B7Z55_06210 [Planctomycetales bacterium 12-60-4]|nr:MAG: hypothetical protein B7Z55_06210 [Planctomycetales bacterium 12-60-4]
MRFWVTTIVVFVCLCLLVFAGRAWLLASVTADLRSLAQAAQARGEWPLAKDPRTITLKDLEDYDTELPGPTIQKISLADIATHAAWLWVPMAVLFSLGISSGFVWPTKR